jgi:hypothetical protein
LWSRQDGVAMTRETYKRIDVIAKFTCTGFAVLATYAGIFFVRSWLCIPIMLASFLPYLIGYNIVVRGWLYRRVFESQEEA